MAVSRTDVLKCVSVIVSLMAKFVSGSVLAFNLYQDAVKSTFNYTQTEVELFASMLATGIGVGFIPGMIYDRYGSTVSNLAGFVISVSAYLLLWSSAKFVWFYSIRAWMIAIYFFFAGFGTSFPYMTAFATALANVHPRHSGTISCLQNAAFVSAPAVNAFVYYKYFNTDGESASQHAFSAYMLYMAIMAGIVDFLCVVFLRTFTDTSEAYSLSSLDRDTRTYNTECKTIMDNPGKDELRFPYSLDIFSFKEVLCNLDYQMFSCMFAFTTAVCWTGFNNITVLSKSVNLHTYNKVVMVIYSVTTPLVSILSGVLSDHFKDKVPRLVFVIVGCLSIVICQIVCIFFADLIIGLFVIAFLIAVCEGIVWSLSPVIMREMFSAHQIGRNWGITVFLSSILIVTVQIIYGLVYDAHVPEGNDKFCYGIKCTQTANIVLLGAGLFAAGIGTFTFLRICRRAFINDK